MKSGYTDGHHGAWIIDPPRRVQRTPAAPKVASAKPAGAGSQDAVFARDVALKLEEILSHDERAPVRLRPQSRRMRVASTP